MAAAADLDVIRLARFLRRVEDGYLPNPYHNKTHAADVLQSQFMLLTAGGLGRRAADPLILLAAVLSAIIHDLDHKGVNNDFLIRQSHELAIVYNGGLPWSPFEPFPCLIFFSYPPAGPQIHAPSSRYYP